MPGCAHGGGGAPPRTPSPACRIAACAWLTLLTSLAPVAADVTVGIPIPLTGANSFFGNGPMRQAAVLFGEMAAEAGGVVVGPSGTREPLNLVFVDDRSTTAGVAAAVTALVTGTAPGAPSAAPIGLMVGTYQAGEWVGWWGLELWRLDFQAFTLPRAQRWLSRR